MQFADAAILPYEVQREVCFLKPYITPNRYIAFTAIRKRVGKRHDAHPFITDVDMERTNARIGTYAFIAR